jgi:hypothetical protein
VVCYYFEKIFITARTVALLLRLISYLLATPSAIVRFQDLEENFIMMAKFGSDNSIPALVQGMFVTLLFSLLSNLQL